MRILVTAATAFELTPFIQTNPDADTLITGVGAAMTTYHLAKKLSSQKYDLVLQSGVAGVYDQKLALGTVVVISADRYADLGAMQNNQFHHVNALGLLDANSFPYHEGWLHNNHLPAFNHLPKAVLGNTVQLLTDNKSHIHNIQGEATVESMEGAAFHFVCLMESVPFLQLRGISNHVGDRDRQTWKLKDAVANSCMLLSEIYQQQITKHQP